MRQVDQGEGVSSRPAAGKSSPGQRPFEAVLASDDKLRAAAQADTGSVPVVSSTPQATSSPFDAADLVDEKALPDWLRSSRETEPLPLPMMVSESIGGLGRDFDAKKSANPGSEVSSGDDDAVPDWLQQVYSDAHVPPLHEDAPPLSAGPKQISGSDLLDRRAVPTWIQEAAQTSPLANISDILAFTPPADQPEKRPLSASGPLANSLSGNSLIEPESLPEWMRNLGDEGLAKSTSGSGFAAEAAQSGASDFFSAPDLVDTHALPAWMKAQEPQASAASPASAADQSAAPGSSSGLFSASELVDTHALPTWMKAQEPAPPSESFAGQPQSAPLGSASGIISAAELVDTQALPTWLKAQGPQAAPTPAPDTSGALSGQSASFGSESGIISATELVDTAALPAWLKAQEPGTTPTSGVSSASGVYDAVRPPSSKMTPMPVGFSKEQTGAFSAAELVDTKALPAWIKNAGGEAGPSASLSGSTAPASGAGAIMGSELVDTGVLPVWLRGAESSPGASGAVAFPPSRGTGPTGSSDQTGGFSAASLVDPEALPEWLRPAQSGALVQSGPLAPSGPLGQSGALGRSGSGADWSQSASRDQGGFSAASLINPNDLPEWMHSQEGVQRPGALSGEGADDEGIPQARVPRRPRLSTEPDRAPSQAAASVFSSVLGPTAGEDPRSASSPGGRSPGARETPAPDRSNPFGQLSAQANQGQNWDNAGASGWNQPQRSEFDQDGLGVSGEWSGSFGGRGMPDEPPERQRPGYRPLGPLSEGQRSRQTFSPPEPDERSGALNRQAGRAPADQGYGLAGGQGPEAYGQRGFGEYPPGQPGRGAAGRGGYQEQYGGWEGGPEYTPGFAGDEAGPPSGMFAKLKRVLGFGR
jgi:hypothetical protein